MYPNNNMYNGFMPRNVAYPQNGYPPQYGGFYQPPYMAAQNGQAQMPPQEPPISEIRFLTADEMKAFIVMPNTKVLLVDKDHGVACLKSADAMGQSTAKMYSFGDLSSEQPEPVQKTEARSYDDEIKALTARIEKLEKTNGKRAESKSESKNEASNN